MINPELKFIIKATHCISELGESMDDDEIKGLRNILSALLIEWRDDHDGLQKRL